MFAPVTVPLRIEAVTADIAAVDLDEMIVPATRYEIPVDANLPYVQVHGSSESGEVNHEATPCRVSTA